MNVRVPPLPGRHAVAQSPASPDALLKGRARFPSAGTKRDPTSIAMPLRSLLRSPWPLLLSLGLAACADAPPSDGGSRQDDGSSLQADGGSRGEQPDDGLEGADQPPTSGGAACRIERGEAGFQCEETNDACRAEPTCCSASGRCCAREGSTDELNLAACLPDGGGAGDCPLQPFGSPAPYILGEGSSGARFVPGGSVREGSGMLWADRPLRIGPAAHTLRVAFLPGTCSMPPEEACPLFVAGVLLLPEPARAQPRLEEAALALLLRADGSLLLLGPDGSRVERGASPTIDPLTVALRVAPSGEVAWSTESALQKPSFRLPAGDYAIALYGRNAQGEGASAPQITALSVSRAACDAPQAWNAPDRLAWNVAPGTRLDGLRAPGEAEAVLVELLRSPERPSRLVLRRLGASLDAAPTEIAQVQRTERWRDVALLADGSGWALWGLDEDGRRAWRLVAADPRGLERAEATPIEMDLPEGTRALRIAASGPVGNEWVIALLSEEGAGEEAQRIQLSKWPGAPEEPGLQTLFDATLEAIGLPSPLVDLEVTDDGQGRWRLWAVLPRGSRTELRGFVASPEFHIGSIEGPSRERRFVLPTGLRWRPVEGPSASLRLESPAMWRESDDTEPTRIRALVLGFDGRTSFPLLRGLTLPSQPTWWPQDGGGP